VTVYANLPMMVSRIPLRAVKSDRPVISDRGDAYRVESRGGVTTVRPEQDFSLLGHLDELKRLGCRRIVVDLSHFAAGSADARRILAALQRDEEVSGTSTFNYLQEMI
jgi:putative protease